MTGEIPAGKAVEIDGDKVTVTWEPAAPDEIARRMEFIPTEVDGAEYERFVQALPGWADSSWQPVGSDLVESVSVERDPRE